MVCFYTQEKKDSLTLKLLTKRSLKEEFELKEEQPVYPDASTIIQFIHSTNSNANTESFKFQKKHLSKIFSENDALIEKRWKLLLWCLEAEAQYRNLLDIPKEFRMILLAINFLHKVGS